jgi:hypothetical protein
MKTIVLSGGACRCNADVASSGDPRNPLDMRTSEANSKAELRQEKDVMNVCSHKGLLV